MAKKNQKNLIKNTIIIFLFFILVGVWAPLAQAQTPAPVTCANANGDISKCSQPFLNCFRTGNCSGIFCTTADSCGNISCDTTIGQCIYDNAPLRTWINTNMPSVNLGDAPFLMKLSSTCKTSSDCTGNLVCQEPGSGSYNGHCEFVANPVHTDNSVPANTYQPLTFTPEVTITGSIFQNGKQVDVGSLNQTTGVISSNLMQKYIAAIYNYGLAIVGILAAIMLMLGGVIWITSEGNQTRVGQAKSIIGSSLIGMILAFTAYMLLRTINPDLVTLNPLKYTNNNLITMGCCQLAGNAEISSEPTCKQEKGSWSLNAQLAIGGKTCTNTGCCVVSTKNTNYNTAAIVQKCLTTPAEQCAKTTGTVNYSGGDQATTQFLSGKCSDLPQCTNTPNPCNNLPDGDQSCGSIYMSCSCYGHKAYVGDGQEGEPCGNHGGSTCQDCHKVCPDGSCCTFMVNNCAKDNSYKNAAGQSFDTNDWGGRNCAAPFDCCHG